MPSTRREPDAELEPGVAEAIAKRFGGDAALYQEFAAACAVQFEVDAAAGQVACKAADLSRLRRLAHNLKSALQMLGHERASELAALVEERAAACDLESACTSWNSLYPALWQLKAR